jgi:hypothetical protein
MSDLNLTSKFFVRLYLNSIVIYGVFDFLFGGFALLIGDRTTFIQIMLTIKFGLDIMFISFNFQHLRFKQIEVFLIILIIINLFVGIFSFPPSIKHLTDFLSPCFFVAKVAIIRHYVNVAVNRSLFERWVLKYAGVMFWVSLLATIQIYILMRYIPLYLGTTPIVYPYFIKSLASSNYFGIIMGIMSIILSGKRAILLGAVIITIIYVSYIKKYFGRLVVSTAVLIFVLTNIYLLYEDILVQSPSISKYKFTVDHVLSDNFVWNDWELIDIISGGRIGEIKGATGAMNSPFNLLVGMGAGFIYPLEYIDGTIEPKHSNVHFSPLGLISKYGILFYLAFMFYILNNLFKQSRNQLLTTHVATILFLYTIGALVDSFFAYTFFIDSLLPLGLGYLYFNRLVSKNEDQIIN